MEVCCQKVICYFKGLEYHRLCLRSDTTQGCGRGNARPWWLWDESWEPRAVLGKEKENCFEIENAALSKRKDKDSWEWGSFFLTGLHQLEFLMCFCFQACLLGLCLLLWLFSLYLQTSCFISLDFYVLDINAYANCTFIEKKIPRKKKCIYKKGQSWRSVL